MNQEHPSLGEPKPVISLRDLRVSYGEREILHGIHFDVMAGETLVILGGSGSGKSMGPLIDCAPPGDASTTPHSTSLS